MSGYTKLFGCILNSSIWSEDDQTRIVWITLLALADKNGEVEASIPGIARQASVSLEAAEKAIAKLESPDRFSRTPDNEGRRIERIDGGWVLLNHAKYRAKASDEDRKVKAAERQKRFRERDCRNAGVTPSNACVTPSNAPVTPASRQNSQAEAEAEADSEASKANPQHKQVGTKKPKAPKAPRPEFVPPTREELDLAAEKLAMTKDQVDAFVGHYGSVGWKVGRNPMVSWQCALSKWAARDRQHHAHRTNPISPKQPHRNDNIMGADELNARIEADAAFWQGFADRGETPF